MSLILVAAWAVTQHADTVTLWSQYVFFARRVAYLAPNALAGRARYLTRLTDAFAASIHPLRMQVNKSHTSCPSSAITSSRQTMSECGHFMLAKNA